MGPGRKELTELAALDVGDLLEHEPLSRHGTWQIGGPADLLVQPRSVAQLSRLRRYVDERGLASVVIGAGSNLLFVGW